MKRHFTRCRCRDQRLTDRRHFLARGPKPGDLRIDAIDGFTYEVHVGEIEHAEGVPGWGTLLTLRDGRTIRTRARWAAWLDQAAAARWRVRARTEELAR